MRIGRQFLALIVSLYVCYYILCIFDLSLLRFDKKQTFQFEQFDETDLMKRF